MRFHQLDLSPLQLTLFMLFVLFCFSPWQPKFIKHHEGHIVQDFEEPSFTFADTSKRTMVSRPSAQAA